MLSCFRRLGAFVTAESGAVHPTRSTGLLFARHAASTIERSAGTAALVQVLPATKNSIRVVWEDRVASQYHFVWLRDNCRCERCVDPGTQQKLLDTSSIALDTVPRDVTFSDGDGDGEMEIVWKADATGGGGHGDGGLGDEHVSKYPASWLRHHAEPFLVEGHSRFTAMPSESATVTQHLDTGVPKVQPWVASQLQHEEMFVDYSDVTSSDGELARRSLLRLSNNIHLFGLAYLKGVPVEDNFVLRIADLVAIAKQTCYGYKFDVIQETPGEVSHLAYSGAELDMHTDLNYREKSPGLQFLHCMDLTWVKSRNSVPAAKQGENIFVDGFAVTEHLRENNPSAFHVLSSTPVTFSILYKEHAYTQQVPIICMGGNDEVEEVHLNNRSMSPLQLPPNMILPFYAAYKSFNDCVRSDEYRYKHQLQPGELVVFNNRRVMHGRTAYDPMALRRKLQGCYSDLDDFHSKYRSLLRSQS